MDLTIDEKKEGEKMKNTCMGSGKAEKKRLETFDDLDYNVFSGQKWEQL